MSSLSLAQEFVGKNAINGVSMILGGRVALLFACVSGASNILHSSLQILGQKIDCSQSNTKTLSVPAVWDFCEATYFVHEIQK